ncbi:hypothetical protein ALC60_11195 [Trachymyrmex zeteki]|uniref:MADF domain-containing protein n=1 Tax=Mycetomoellerius zeteki TaxID=64791 RepID=A0A151WPJ8_9HYME|nr:hypothetical protein ALC60_11195 [Trachymyrmex zeteki]
MRIELSGVAKCCLQSVVDVVTKNGQLSSFPFYDAVLLTEAIEKRWTSLRDMFSREKRKQQLPPSSSRYKHTKEWELYKTMLFLNPYIEHRRTKTSLSLVIGQSSCSTQSEIEKNLLYHHVNMTLYQSVMKQ